MFSHCTEEAKTIKTGLDVLIEDNFKLLEGKSVGIITNHTALDAKGKHLADILYESPKVSLKAIFAPEHGFRGSAEAGADIKDGVDKKTGLPVYSIYGKDKKPSPEILKDLELLVFDIQDIGARFYTYISTMGYCMEAAAENNLPFVVLDRPNPLGRKVEGAVLDTASYRSFVGMYPIPIQHGLTVGELAQMIKGENWMNSDLSKLELIVVPVENWKTDKFYADWPAPSPNIPDLETALIYPGTCLLEGTNISEGRGCDMPFLQMGAPWMNAAAVLKELQTCHIYGAVLDTIQFTPQAIPGKSTNPKYKDELCKGIVVRITDKQKFNGLNYALHFISIVSKLHPDEFIIKERWMNLLWGGPELSRTINEYRDVNILFVSYKKEKFMFSKKSEQYLLY